MPKASNRSAINTIDARWQGEERVQLRFTDVAVR